MSDEASIVSDLSVWSTGAFILFGLCVLGLRLRDVQVDNAASSSLGAERQRVRVVRTGAPRGRILDRRGNVLADNRPSVSIAVMPEHFEQRTTAATVAAIATSVSNVAACINRPYPLTERTIRRHVQQSLAMPLEVWRDVSDTELARFCEHRWDFPGVVYLPSEERHYPHGSLAAHVIGYVGRDRPEGDGGDGKVNFTTTEMRGRGGLEIYYDSFLRGDAGRRKVQVDARGFARREWTEVPPRRGPDLHLTLDVAVQRAAERVLKDGRGACAVIDPANGDVLALASAPTYDLGDFVPTLSVETYTRYATDEQKPLLNRASGGAYAPGSTFKPITALAGLGAGCDPEIAYECVGTYLLGQMSLHCTSRWGHGPLNLYDALKRSCNPYFCNLGVQTGTNALFRAALAFGLGRKTGIDLGVDMAGAVPDEAWKRRVYGERWYPGDLAQMAIGQGMLLVSPLQMARVAGAIGTGRLVRPHLKQGLDPQSVELPFPTAHLLAVREGMRRVVNDRGGTGRRGGERVRAEIIGKTGTAEIGRGEKKRKNAWFIAYARGFAKEDRLADGEVRPGAKPIEVAMALVVENGDSGGGTSAPKAREVLAEIFGVEVEGRGEGGR